MLSQDLKNCVGGDSDVACFADAGELAHVTSRTLMPWTFGLKVTPCKRRSFTRCLCRSPDMPNGAPVLEEPFPLDSLPLSAPIASLVPPSTCAEAYDRSSSPQTIATEEHSRATCGSSPFQHVHAAARAYASLRDLAFREAATTIQWRWRHYCMKCALHEHGVGTAFSARPMAQEKVDAPAVPKPRASVPPLLVLTSVSEKIIEAKQERGNHSRPEDVPGATTEEELAEEQDDELMEAPPDPDLGALTWSVKHVHGESECTHSDHRFFATRSQPCQEGPAPCKPEVAPTPPKRARSRKGGRPLPKLSGTAPGPMTPDNGERGMPAWAKRSAADTLAENGAYGKRPEASPRWPREGCTAENNNAAETAPGVFRADPPASAGQLPLTSPRRVRCDSQDLGHRTKVSSARQSCNMSLGELGSGSTAMAATGVSALELDLGSHGPGEEVQRSLIVSAGFPGSYADLLLAPGWSTKIAKRPLGAGLLPSLATKSNITDLVSWGIGEGTGTPRAVDRC